MKPSGKEHLCGLREDETPGAVDAVSGVFLSVHTSTIQRGSLFCQAKNERNKNVFKRGHLWYIQTGGQGQGRPQQTRPRPLRFVLFSWVRPS